MTCASRRAGVICSVGLAALALGSSSTAEAAVTIGSALGASDGTLACSAPGGCTAVQTALPGSQVTAPSDGVVVRWRVKETSSGVPGRFRVLRPAGGKRFTGAGSAVAATGNCPDICVNEVRLPICAGDYIGIDGPMGASAGRRDTDGAVLAVVSPFLGDGETRASGSEFLNEILLNADVEADADGDGLGDETQDPDPTSPGGARPRCDRPSPSLSLRLRYRRGRDAVGVACAAGGSVSAAVTGADRDGIRRVAFRFGRRDPLPDERPPFVRSLDHARHRGSPHHHHVVARILMNDGRRAALRRRLRFCGDV